MARIYGYIVVEHSPGLSDDKTLAINIICSSNYSDGMSGSYNDFLLNMIEKLDIKI